MNKETLLKRLTDIEWDDFEVKQARREIPKSVWETVGAFANTAGGWLIFGIAQKNKKFEIIGVEEPEKIESDFITTLRSHSKFNAIINPKCMKYDIDGKTILGFFIPVCENKPIYFNNLQNTFIRTASGDQRASEYEINTLYRNQAFGTMSNKSVKGTSIKSFNENSYKNFRDYLKRMVPDLQYNKLPDMEFNQKLQLVKNGELTYGGLLFLGGNDAIQEHFPDFRIDYLEIPGLSYTNAQPRYTFRIQEQENLWEYYFVLFQRLRNYADNPLYIGEMGGGYEDDKQISALREALINMLIHCDYFSPMKPRIRVFSNRIEFENPGAFPRPLSELMKEDVSIPRNPVLAKLFRCAKLCENAGYGFDKMLAWKKETKKEVLFESTIDMTKITFMLDDKDNVSIKQPENSQKTTRKLPENKEKTTRKLPENYQKTTRKLPENKDSIEFSILEILKNNPNISRSDISKQLKNISSDLVKYYLDKMKKNKIIKRKGPDKGGKWVVLGVKN